jgi:hypothetical protein
MEMSGQLHAPAALLPGKEPLVLIGWEAAWAAVLVLTLWSIGRSLDLVGNRIAVFQPVIHLYTD